MSSNYICFISVFKEDSENEGKSLFSLFFNLSNLSWGKTCYHGRFTDILVDYLIKHPVNTFPSLVI